MDSLGKSLSQIIDERLSNPLVVSFIFAWCGWNYKFLVLLFSNTPATQTFELIEQIAYPHWHSYLLPGFLYPLGTTLLYIYALPFFSKHVNDHWRKNQLNDQRNRQQYEDKRLLTEEESREYRSRERKQIEENDRLHRVIEQGRGDLAAMESRIVEITAQFEEANKVAKEEMNRTTDAKGEAEALAKKNSELMTRLNALASRLQNMEREFSEVSKNSRRFDSSRDPSASYLERIEDGKFTVIEIKHSAIKIVLRALEVERFSGNQLKKMVLGGTQKVTDVVEYLQIQDLVECISEENYSFRVTDKGRSLMNSIMW